VGVRRLLVPIVISLAAAGCMGGDNEAVSREDYVAKADVICGNYQVRLSQIPRPVTASPVELGSYLKRALPIAHEQLEKLKELERPSDETDRRDVDRLLVLLEQELDLNDAAQRAASAGNRASLDSNLQQGAQLAAEANQLSEQVGFVVCARNA
jgi:hypothetical protein